MVATLTSGVRLQNGPNHRGTIYTFLSLGVDSDRKGIKADHSKSKEKVLLCANLMYRQAKVLLALYTASCRDLHHVEVTVASLADTLVRLGKEYFVNPVAKAGYVCAGFVANAAFLFRQRLLFFGQFVWHFWPRRRDSLDQVVHHFATRLVPSLFNFLQLSFCIFVRVFLGLFIAA